MLSGALALAGPRACFGGSPALTFSYSAQPLYASVNLAGHRLAPECNPGGGSSCACSSNDVSLVSYPNYGVVTSNIRAVNTWVNAIGYKPFNETFPNGQPVRLGSYRYCASVRLPVLPQPNPAQIQNPEAVHLMIQLWDGRNALWTANQHTLEGTIYWNLNPWTSDYGHIKIYTYPETLVDTGIQVTPDTAWHRFSLAVDLVNRTYLFLTVDNQATNLSAFALAQVAHPDWGTNVALNLTTESLASWPGASCGNVFVWSTYFQNLSFSAFNEQLAWNSAAGTNYFVQYSTDLKNWTNWGGAVAGTGSNLVYRGPFCDCNLTNVFYRLRVGN